MTDLSGSDLTAHVIGSPATAHPVLRALAMAYPQARLIRQDRLAPGVASAGGCTIDQTRTAIVLANAPASGAAADQPDMLVLRQLGMAVAAFVRLDDEDDVVHSFLRQHGWGAWLRIGGQLGNRVWHWPDVLAARAVADANAGATRDASYLQVHLPGPALRVAAVALAGRVLNCVAVERASARQPAWTEAAVPADVKAVFRTFLSACGWTGGAEIVFRRPAPDHPPLAIAVRPRFPDWTGGAAQCGVNLPAELVRAVTGIPAAPDRGRAALFVRVPHDVPWTGPNAPSDSTSTPLTRHHAVDPPSAWPADIPERPLLRDLAELAGTDLQTPQWRLLPRVARVRFGVAADLQMSSSQPDLAVRVAYSIKTNPDPRMIELALEHRLLADAISQEEVSAALRAGFRHDEIVLNGPAKWWPAQRGDGQTYHMVFCDSLTEFARTVSEHGTDLSVLGVRLRPPGLCSRFGIPADDVTGLARLLRDAPQQASLGVHFHYPGVVVGFSRWWRLVGETVASAIRLQDMSNRMVTVLDIGGGWHPLDWQHGWLDSFRQFVRDIRQQLPGLSEVIVEPGEALAQPAGAVMTRVLERRLGADSEIVVDASAAELPEARSYPHPVLLRGPNGWRLVPPGHGRVLGRLCMELDVLATGIDVDRIPEGSLLCFSRAGSYDRSMSYQFGRGQTA